MGLKESLYKGIAYAGIGLASALFPSYANSQDVSQGQNPTAVQTDNKTFQTNSDTSGWKASEPRIKLEDLVGVWYGISERVRYDKQDVRAEGNLIIFNQNGTYTELTNGIPKTEKFKVEETADGNTIHFYQTEKELEQPNAHISGYILLNGNYLDISLPVYPAERTYSKTKPQTVLLEHRVVDGRDIYDINLPKGTLKNGRYSPILENQSVCTVPDFDSSIELGKGGKVDLLNRIQVPDDAEKLTFWEFMKEMNEKFPGNEKGLETLYAIYSIPREEYDKPENRADKERTEGIIKSLTFEQLQEYAKKYPWIVPDKDALNRGLTYEDEIFIGINEAYKSLSEIVPLLH